MIVLDSSFLCAWYNDRDNHHPNAREIMQRFLAGEWGRGLLLEYVFMEVVTVLLARRGHDSALEGAQHLLNARELDFVPCSDIFIDTLEAFRTHAVRGLSFTDAAIVTVARRFEPPMIATFDRGFTRIEGLEIIPGEFQVHEGRSRG